MPSAGERRRPERRSNLPCSHKGKRRYRDKAQATRALHLIQSRGVKRERTPVRAFQCHACKGWYLTSEASR